MDLIIKPIELLAHTAWMLSETDDIEAMNFAMEILSKIDKEIEAIRVALYAEMLNVEPKKNESETKRIMLGLSIMELHDYRWLISNRVVKRVIKNKPRLSPEDLEDWQDRVNSRLYQVERRLEMLGEVKRSLAETIRENQDNKEMTRQAIILLEKLGENAADLREEFEEVYGEEV